jgi:hypothetical protein
MKLAEAESEIASQKANAHFEPKETVNAPQAPETVEGQSSETPQETAAAPLPNPLAKYIPENLSEAVPDDVIKVLNDVKGADETPTAVRQEAADYLDMIFEAEGTESYGDEVTDARAWLTDVVAKHQTKKGPVRTVVSAPAGTPTTKKAKQAKPLGMAAQLGVTAEDAHAPAVEEEPVVQPTLSAAAVTRLLTSEQKKDVKDYYGGKQASAIESLVKDYAQWKVDPLTFTKHPMRSVLESIRKKASTQFSKTMPNTPEERTTVQKIQQALRSWFLSPEQAASRLVVVQKWEDLSQAIRDRVAEAQKSVLKVTDYSGDTAYVFSNPERVQALNLLAKRENHDQIRGFMDDSGRITHVFPSAGLTHGRVANQLGFAQIHTADGKNHEFGSDYWFKSDLGEIMYPVYISGNEHQLSWHSIMGTKTGVIPDSAFGGVQFSKSLTNIQAFVLDGKGYMIADNISSGNEMAVFMHEIGAHIGLDGQETQIMERVNLWSAEPFGSLEREIYDKMQARMEAAGEVSDSEKVAYAVEEAVKAGVTPRAVKMGMKLSDVKSAQDLVSWFAQYFKAAVDAVFKTNTRGFNAQQLVDLAYGAARDAMQNQEVGADVTAMSKKGFGPVDTGSPEFKQWFGDSVMVTPPDKKKWREAYELEGHLFGGSRSISRLRIAAKDAPIRKLIPVSQARYNALRKEFGLPEVTDWTKPPEELVQRFKGKPLLVYTGTSKDKDFTKFNVPKRGVWFTADRDSASGYAQDNESRGLKAIPGTWKYEEVNTASRVIPVYLSIQKMYTITPEDLKLLKVPGYKAAQGRFFDTLRSQGYDGVDFGGGVYVVLGSPTQIKSSVSNTGEFSDTNPDIRFSLASTLKPQVAKYLGPTGVQFWDGAARFVRNVMLETISLPELVHRYEERVPGLRKLYDAMLASQNRKIELDQEVDTLMQQIEGAKLSKEQVKTINQFLMDSTTEQKWAYDPKFKRKTTVDPEFEKRFNGKDFTDEMREIVKQVFQHGETTMERKREVFKLIGVADPFKRLTQLQGPYSPLRRFGEYMVEVKSLALVAEESKQEDGEGGFKDTKKIDELRSDPDHYRISFRTTEAEAKRLYNELMATGKYARSQNLSYVGPRVERAYTSSDINRSSLAKVLESVKGDETLDRDTRNKMENTVKDLYHQMMEDHLARQSMRQRKYRAGADENMLEAFFKQARSESAFLANMEHAQKVNEATYQVSKNTETHAKEQRLQDVVNTMMKHRKLMLEFKDTPWQDAAVGFTSAMQLATSPGYHFANATQPAMKTVPMLAAEFNDYSGAWTHLNTGYKIYAQALKDKFDFAKIKSPGLRKMLETASKMNLIDVGMGEDYDQYNSPRTGFEKVDAGLNNGRKVIHKLRQVSRGVERANRISASVAAYNMAIAKGRTHDQAQAFAIQVLGQTQGDFSQLAAPLIIKKLPKFITQYRKYQLMVAALYVRSFYDAFSGSSPAEKAIARRMLGYMLAHTAMVGGVMGLPLMNLAEFVIPALFGDDDEPKDLERMMREWFGSDIPADIILKGLPSMLGLDLGSKLSDDRVFSILPYTTLEMSKKGAAEALVGLMGPGMGLARKMIDGVDLMQNGEIGQGMEKLLPKGLEDAHKGYRLANKGVVLRNGDVLVTPEDINAFTIVMQGMGMPTSELKRYQWIQSQQIEITKFYTARESEIKKDYIEAQRAGEDTTDLKDQWKSLQDRKSNMRVYFGNQVDELKAKPLSTLMDAPNKQQRRELKRQETMAEG